MQAARTGNTGTGSQPLTPSPSPPPPPSLFKSPWMASRCTDQPVRLIGPALHRRHRSAPKHVVQMQPRSKVQFVAAFVRGTAALLFHSQEEPFRKFKRLLAPVPQRTKKVYTEPDERRDRVNFIFKCPYRSSRTIYTGASGLN